MGRESLDVKNWLTKALRDLESAKYNLKGGFKENAVYFAHQSAEKALKTLFIKKFRYLWKVHHLVDIAKRLKCPKPLIKICDRLNQHYIATKYPTDVKYAEKDAKKAIEDAEKVVKWIRKKLKL